MNQKITVNIDSEILNRASQLFGLSRRETDYTELLDKMFRYFITNQTIDFQSDKCVTELIVEPIFSVEDIEKNYNFNVSEIEGQWPGNEPIEKLTEMLKA